jgi:hypothetical protein
MNSNVLLVLQFISKRNRDSDSQTVYNAAKKPSMSISKYAHRIYKYIIKDPEMLAFVMYYLAVYIDNTRTEANRFNIHRLFLTAATVAHKFWDDFCYENKELAKIAGVDVKELNRLEIDFIKGIDWGLYKLQTRITDDELIQILNRIMGVNYNIPDCDE